MSPYLNIMRVRAGKAETTEYGDMGDMASFRPAGYRVSMWDCFAMSTVAACMAGIVTAFEAE